MRKWTLLLIAVVAMALVAGCAATKKSAAPENAGGGAAPKITAAGVVFSFQAPAGTKAVYLAGEFNGWRPDLDLMKDADGDGIWTLTYKLSAGTYQYKYVADGRWYQDPNNSAAAPDGFGGNNSVLVVP